MYWTYCGTVHPVLLNRLSKVNTSCGLAVRSSFISEELKAGGIAYVYVRLESSYDPPECHPGQLAYTYLIRRLTPQFQFYVSAVSPGIYLGATELHLLSYAAPF
jgi:hypothetical protein